MKQDFYRNVIENLNIGYACHEIICDEKGVPVDYLYLEVNKAFETFTGLERKDLIGKTYLEAIPHAEKSEFNWPAYYGEVAINEVSKELEQYSEHFNKWYRIYTYAPEKGKFITIFSDITEDIKRNEEYQMFFSMSLDLFCISDLEGRLLKVNQAWEEVLGYSREELEESYYLDYIHQEDQASTRNVMHTLAEKKKIPSFINRYRKKDGSYLYLEWRSRVKNNLVYATARDVTDTVNKRSIMETVLNHIDARIYISDLDTYEILFMNEYGKKQYGDVTGKKCWEVLHKEKDGPCDFCNIEKIYGPHANPEGKYRWEYQSDFTGKWLDVHERVIPWVDGRLVHMQVAVDIDEMKQMEMVLRAAKEEAEASNLAKTHFLANTSHEIRTPMNGILGFLNLLEHTSLDKEQRLFVENIKNSGDLLLRVINDILDISKIESGKIEIEKIPFQIRSTIEDVVTLMTEKAFSKKVELNMLIHSRVPNMVLGDPTRMKQVLQNILGNAMKFTEKGNVFIDISVKEEDLERVVLEFKIQDTGIGMDEKTLAGLFQPFTQADASSTRKYGGTGLGLSISKKITDLMGGSIEVKSRLHHGSTFIITIPFGKTEDISSPQLIDYTYLQGRRVLLVDDNPMNLEIGKIYLEEEGAVVSVADSGPAALRELLSDSPGKSGFDVILMDYQMPGMDGFDLIRAIRAIPAFQAIPALLITSMAGLRQADEARSHDFAGYLTKPYKRRELLDCVALLFDLDYRKERETVEKEQAVFLTRHKTREIQKNKEKRVLVVEDNEINRLLLVKLLQNLGIQPDLANDGLEAVEAFSHRNYDLIFMDCQMPVMDGYQATMKIRQMAMEKEANPKIVATTAFAMKEDEKKCREAGMDAYLSKPIVHEELLKIVESYIL